MYEKVNGVEMYFNRLMVKSNKAEKTWYWPVHLAWGKAESYSRRCLGYGCGCIGYSKRRRKKNIREKGTMLLNSN